DEIIDHLSNTHMCFVTAGMGGGTGTGAAPVVARAAREKGILTVGVVTKPFHFEGQRRMKTADLGIEELQKCVDTLIVIPNQNLFRLANDKTTFADAFAMADQVLYSGVACITDLMVKEGLINLDFADVRSVMREMGKAMMGTGEASGEGRAMAAAEALRDEEKAKKAEEEKNSVKASLATAEIELLIGKQLSTRLLVSHQELVFRMAKMRKKFAQQYGFVVPEVRVADDFAIPPKSYQIKVHGTVVAEYQMRVGETMVLL
ncbi:MAG: hypothetical protein E5Y89_24600, partial [Mesorhizobium sp.]